MSVFATPEAQAKLDEKWQLMQQMAGQPPSGTKRRQARPSDDGITAEQDA
jgi:hypothetical protein